MSSPLATERRLASQPVPPPVRFAEPLRHSARLSQLQPIDPPKPLASAISRSSKKY